MVLLRQPYIIHKTSAGLSAAVESGTFKWLFPFIRLTDKISLRRKDYRDLPWPGKGPPTCSYSTLCCRWLTRSCRCWSFQGSWAEGKGIDLEFIWKGKPTQNSYVERFNKTYRDESLDFYIFHTLSEVRERTDIWLKENNCERPHESLGTLSPVEYLQSKQPELSQLLWD